MSMEKPGLQYERTLLSWWRTLLAMVVSVAAISRVGLKSSNHFLVIVAVVLLFIMVIVTLITSIELTRNIKGKPSSTYGPLVLPKRGLSAVLVFGALFYALYIIISW